MPATGADPASTADRAVVIAGAGFDAKHRKRNKQLAVEDSAAAINELAAILTDIRPGDPMYWMEWPEMSVAFLKDRQLLAEYGLLTGGWIRTSEAGDRELRTPERLVAWLNHHGVELGG